MASYYVSATVLSKVGNKFYAVGDPKYIGPYDKKGHAEEDLREKKSSPEINYKIVTEREEPPIGSLQPILLEILTQTQANRSGMKDDDIVGLTIPEDIQKLFPNIEPEAVEENYTSNKEYEDEVIEDEDVESQPSVDSLFEFEISEAKIFTPYEQNVEWLRTQGIKGPFMGKWAKPENIANLTVIGTFPYRLAEKTKRIGEIDAPDVKTGNGNEWTVQDLITGKARLRWYRVIEEKDEMKKLFYFMDRSGGLNKLLNFIDNELGL